MITRASGGAQPFLWLGCSHLAAIVRAARSLHGTDLTVASRLLAIVGGAAVISTALVIAIDAALHYY